jgi:hypothetical protein
MVKTHDFLQEMLMRYPSFTWMGEHGRRVKGEERFIVGGYGPDEANYELREAHSIRCLRLSLEWRLLEHIEREIGRAVVSEDPLPPYAVADARALRAAQ